MTHGTFTVRQIAETSVPDIIIKDNGNGKILFSGPAMEAVRSAFADLPVEYISVGRTGSLVLSIHHDASSAVYFTKVKIPKDIMKTINGYLKAKKEDEFQPEDNTIVYTAVFPDGKEMDIKCCGSQDEASWTEAVLFDEHGGQLCFTDPDEDYEGTWELEYEGTRYVAIVQPEEKEES